MEAKSADSSKESHINLTIRQMTNTGKRVDIEVACPATASSTVDSLDSMSANDI